jgi:hypothetical protein
VDRAEDYGENCFEFYDQIYSAVDPKVLETLQRLAADSAALELGIGTGRIALPLAARGVDIHGVEASSSMLTRLREKPGGSEVSVWRGNFAEQVVGGPFSLVFSLVSTFFLLRSPEEQQRCFHTVAAKLSAGGVFLQENYEAVSLQPAQSGNGGDRIFVTEQVIQTADGPRNYRARLCQASPHELDRMAANAGLRLRERWRNWRANTYRPGDALHISLFEHERVAAAKASAYHPKLHRRDRRPSS